MRSAAEVAGSKATFLRVLAETGSAVKARKAAGIGGRQQTNWLRDDESFAAAFADARDEADDAIRDETRRRAFGDEGSDALLSLMYRAATPELQPKGANIALNAVANAAAINAPASIVDAERGVLDVIARICMSRSLAIVPKALLHDLQYDTGDTGKALLAKHDLPRWEGRGMIGRFTGRDPAADIAAAIAPQLVAPSPDPDPEPPY